LIDKVLALSVLLILRTVFCWRRLRLDRCV